MEGYKRSDRVASRMREELTLLLRALHDPRLAGAVITRVELTDDLSFARVFVRQELIAMDEASTKKLLRGFDAAASRLRQQTGKALGLRHAPELRFVFDSGQDAAMRVEEILREIAKEKS
ncbi:MAG: 30S ribosome-binding factor RbfA [Polyangiaceae bacterium]|nr:30S ribosome-binding factor RbfA [Polyangiaceae bacterium]